MSEPTIKLNPAKPSDIEFEVSVQGADDSAPPTVRIVMDGCDDYKCLFECKHVGGIKWTVHLPVLTHFTRTTVPFCVEVIVDGYHFTPVEGTAQLMESPQVAFKTPQGAKPTVTTSFTVKQAEEDEQVSPQYGGEQSPTNQLMRTEFDPSREQGNVKIGNAPVYDQMIDKTEIEDISSSVTPGETTDPEPQHGNNPTDEGDEEEFDPRRVAESIVHKTLGNAMVKPDKQGTLFKRDQSGKAVIAGIESPATKAKKEEKAQRVREILNPTK